MVCYNTSKARNDGRQNGYTIIDACEPRDVENNTDTATTG
jgi:hypothetical protein